MEAVRAVLGQVGTWDLLQLSSGEQLRGDYQGCPYVALDRQETGTLEFSGAKTLSPDSLWALLGHAPQVRALNKYITHVPHILRHCFRSMVLFSKSPAGGSKAAFCSATP